MFSFEDLLQPISTSEFLSTYWDKTHVHVQPSSRSKLASLPGLSQFPTLFCGNLTAERWESDAYQGGVQASWLDSLGNLRTLNADSSQYSALYNAGASLCFGPVESRHPTLSAFVEDVLKHTGFDGEVWTTAYLTPPHSGGVMHFDNQHVFFCQVSGEKHWKVSTEPAMKWPPVNVLASTLVLPETRQQLVDFGWPVTPSSESSFADILLKEGDVLYMPPGVWHEQRTADSHSLHYTLTLGPISSWNVLFSFLRMTMMKSPEWRRDLRFLGAASTDGEEAVVERMLVALRSALNNVSARELLEIYRSTENLPPDFRALFRTE